MPLMWLFVINVKIHSNQILKKKNVLVDLLMDVHNILQKVFV